MSAELLTHARDNDVLDSTYYPINASVVETSYVFDNIKNGTTYFGTSNFPNSGTVENLDLYYALHSFYYSKSISNNVIVIQDRYDYEDTDWTSVANIAIDTMHGAQDAGVIVPFNSIIIRNFNNKPVNQIQNVILGYNQGIYENRITLGPNEYKDLTVTFSANGVKVFQTFGPIDTVIELYDPNGNLIVSNNDAGYKFNSFIKVNLYANKHYKLRVKFNNPFVSGEAKLVITPSTGASKSGNLLSFEDIYETSSANFAFNTFAEENKSRLFLYTPTITKKTYNRNSRIHRHIFVFN